ncbi:hypothetical protein PENTCL1PPCAC_27622, partial [Pristionchus entomophagus]
LLGYSTLLVPLLDFRILSLVRLHGDTERRGRRRRGGGEEGLGGISTSVALTGSDRRSTVGAHSGPAHVITAHTRRLRLATPLLLLLFLLLPFLLFSCLLFLFSSLSLLLSLLFLSFLIFHLSLHLFLGLFLHIS